MPKDIIHLRVFVASPNDVSEERFLIEDVIRKMNTKWADNLAIHLDLVRWETHSFPGAGDDAQAVINEQIGDDFDIFVGILWKRFGTSTERAGSGTSEEFERAFERYGQNPDRLRIMFYFNNSPVPPSEMDPDELAHIRSFRDQLGEQGIYWWEYKSVEDFEHLIELHLTKQVQDFGKGWGTGKEESQAAKLEISPPTESSQDAKLEDSKDELGFLDYFETGGERFDLAAEIMTRIGSASVEVASKMTNGTDELNELKRAGAGAKEQKLVINRIAREMNAFSDHMEEDVPNLAKAYREGIGAYVGAAQLLTDFTTSKEELVDLLKSARSMKANVLEFLESAKTAAAAISEGPRITKDFNRAKRRTTQSLMNLAEELDSGIKLTEEFEKLLEEEIDRKQD